MKRTATDTGIYKTVTESYSADEPGFMEALDRYFNQQDLVRALGAMQQRAKEVLAKIGIERPEPVDAAATSERKEEFRNAWASAVASINKAKPDAKDAWALLENIDDVLRAVGRRKTVSTAAALACIRIGRDYERMSVRWAEPLVDSAERAKPKERNRERNALIRADKIKGLSVGQICLRHSLTKKTVDGILRRKASSPR